MKAPQVGNSVHYVSHGTPTLPDGTQAYTSQCRAARITEVGGWVTTEVEEFPRVEVITPGDLRSRMVRQEWDPSLVGLEVANPTGLFFHSLAGGAALTTLGGRASRVPGPAMDGFTPEELGTGAVNSDD
ncbi:MAG: hypothetical protein ACRDTZ_04645 [Pseudonocardiaceae bacterium]